MLKEKICVYTCITGLYDDIKELSFKEEGIDYYCFTNNPEITSKTWKVIQIEDAQLEDKVLARKLKILGHPMIWENYNASLWIDGAFTIEKSIKEFLGKYCENGKSLLAVPIHHERSSVFDEIDEVVRLKRETKANALRIKRFLLSEKYEDKLGLYETGILYRRHNNEIVRQTMKIWFNMIEKYSTRDQISFPYALQETKIRYQKIDINVFNNEYFFWHIHSPSNIDEKFQNREAKKG
ncbi:DUF616 domain-containing protein [Patescibacteria group bacterium]|nr:DUF616 domain-containing protein [Patescibacteria group bacterium]